MIHSESYQSLKAKLSAYILQKTEAVVQAGPFAGMILPSHHTWGDGMDMSSKLLGFYEQELHGWIEEAIARGPDLILNVGCAEGYYAIGMAIRTAGSRILAFDIDEQSQTVCRQYASVNNVSDRIHVMGKLSAEELEDHLLGSTKPFLVVDCEGCELDLLRPDVAPSLLFSTLLIECHDFANALITKTLVERFSTSHRITIISEGARDPNTSPILAELGSSYRWMAVDEGRPQCMNWIHAAPIKGLMR